VTGINGLYQLASLLSAENASKFFEWSLLSPEQKLLSAKDDLVLDKGMSTIEACRRSFEISSNKLHHKETAHDPLYLLHDAMIMAKLFKDSVAMTSGSMSTEAYVELVLQHVDEKFTLKDLKNMMDMGRRYMLLTRGHIGILGLVPQVKAKSTDKDNDDRTPTLGTSFAPSSIYQRAQLPILRAMGDALGPEHWKRGICSLGQHAQAEMENPTPHSSQHADELATFRDMRHQMPYMSLQDVSNLLHYWMMRPCDCVVDMDKLEHAKCL
jgi:hypothetical protein